jgi:hypothetical protein
MCGGYWGLSGRSCSNFGRAVTPTLEPSMSATTHALGKQPALRRPASAMLQSPPLIRPRGSEGQPTAAAEAAGGHGSRTGAQSNAAATWQQEMADFVHAEPFDGAGAVEVLVAPTQAYKKQTLWMDRRAHWDHVTWAVAGAAQASCSSFRLIHVSSGTALPQGAVIGNQARGASASAAEPEALGQPMVVVAVVPS